MFHSGEDRWRACETVDEQLLFQMSTCRQNPANRLMRKTGPLVLTAPRRTSGAHATRTPSSLHSRTPSYGRSRNGAAAKFTPRHSEDRSMPIIGRRMGGIRHRIRRLAWFPSVSLIGTYQDTEIPAQRRLASSLLNVGRGGTIVPYLNGDVRESKGDDQTELYPPHLGAIIRTLPQHLPRKILDGVEAVLPIGTSSKFSECLDAASSSTTWVSFSPVGTASYSGLQA